MAHPRDKLLFSESSPRPVPPRPAAGPATLPIARGDRPTPTPTPTPPHRPPGPKGVELKAPAHGPRRAHAQSILRRCSGPADPARELLAARPLCFSLSPTRDAGRGLGVADGMDHAPLCPGSGRGSRPAERPARSRPVRGRGCWALPNLPQGRHRSEPPQTRTSPLSLPCGHGKARRVLQAGVRTGPESPAAARTPSLPLRLPRSSRGPSG